MVASSHPSRVLNDGNSIPVVGLGVWQTPAEDTERAVGAALAAGYRHVDTAAAYRNETETGRAIAAADVAREDVYLVTKLWNADQGYDKALRAFDASIARLGRAPRSLSDPLADARGERIRRHLQGARGPS